MKKILSIKWQKNLLALLFLCSVIFLFIALKLALIFSGIFFITFGVIYNINANPQEEKYYNKSDVMKTSPITVISISIGLFLLFKSTL